jgi:hypothetical protein
MFVGEKFSACRHSRGMLNQAQLIAQLDALRKRGKATNAEIGRIIGQPSSRVAEIFGGRRRVQLDEAVKLVKAYDLDDGGGFNAVGLRPVLAAVLRLAPRGNLSDGIVESLVQAVERTLELVGTDPATQASHNPIELAARVAVDQFLEERPTT